MTLTLELSPQLEDRLREVAARNGLAPAAYVQRVLDRDLSGEPPADHLTSTEPREAPTTLWGTIPPEEWSRLAREWVNSHDPTLPLLPDEAVSRASFYDDRP